MGQAKTLKAAAAIQAVFTEELKVYQWPTTIPVTATYIPLEHVGVSPQGNPQSTYMANGKAVLSNLDLQATLGLLTCRMWACRLARAECQAACCFIKSDGSSSFAPRCGRPQQVFCPTSLERAGSDA